MSFCLTVLARVLRGTATTEPQSSPLDAQLVDRCLRGQRDAFDALYKRHVVAVHRRLSHLVGRGADVEDLVQQTFLEAFRSLPRFRREASFGTWLHRITTHVAMGELRRRRRKPAEATDHVVLDLHQSADRTNSPELQASQRQRYERALRHLHALKPAQRVAFVLRHIEGLSLAEIGQLVGANPPAVGQRVKQAERCLLRSIERENRRAGYEENARE